MDDFLEAIEDGLGLVDSDGVAKGWSGSLFSEPFFDLIEKCDESQDGGCVFLFGFECIVKFPPNVGHAAAEVKVTSSRVQVAKVGVVAIALEGSVEVGSRGCLAG